MYVKPEEIILMQRGGFTNLFDQYRERVWLDLYAPLVCVDNMGRTPEVAHQSEVELERVAHWIPTDVAKVRR